MTMSAVSIIIAMLGSGLFLSVANGQSQTTNNNNTAGAAGATKKPLPGTFDTWLCFGCIGMDKMGRFA